MVRRHPREDRRDWRLPTRLVVLVRHVPSDRNPPALFAGRSGPVPTHMIRLTGGGRSPLLREPGRRRAQSGVGRRLRASRPGRSPRVAARGPPRLLVSFAASSVNGALWPSKEPLRWLTSLRGDGRHWAPWKASVGMRDLDQAIEQVRGRWDAAATWEVIHGLVTVLWQGGGPDGRTRVTCPPKSDPS
jgi:hypothetical protein